MLSEIKTVLKQNMINREAYKKWVVVGLYCLSYILRLLLFSTVCCLLLMLLSGLCFSTHLCGTTKSETVKKKELELSCDADFGPPVRSCVIRDFQVKTCKHHE